MLTEECILAADRVPRAASNSGVNGDGVFRLDEELVEGLISHSRVSAAGELSGGSILLHGIARVHCQEQLQSKLVQRQQEQFSESEFLEEALLRSRRRRPVPTCLPPPFLLDYPSKSRAISPHPKNPPSYKNSVVIYTTSLRGVRRTYDDCSSMDAAFMKELRAILRHPARAPRGGGRAGCIHGCCLHEGTPRPPAQPPIIVAPLPSAGVRGPPVARRRGGGPAISQRCSVSRAPRNSRAPRTATSATAAVGSGSSLARSAAGPGRCSTRMLRG